MRTPILLTALLCIAAPAGAAVTALEAGGFIISAQLHVAASPARSYAVLTQPSLWWGSEHTYSGNAANLHLEARAGGCWCESLPGGGSVQHMTVDYVDPGKTLRLRGALGPLGAMALDGVMSFALKPADGGTDIAVRYQVGGYAPGGFKDLEPAVDEVLMAQLAGLTRVLDKP